MALKTTLKEGGWYRHIKFNKKGSLKGKGLSEREPQQPPNFYSHRKEVKKNIITY
jgi:hypothetical protein